MSHQTLIITLLSDDKPGVVQTVADTISQNGGNWLESRMSQLAGKFAGILRVQVNNNNADTLRSALQELSATGIQLLIDTANDSNANSLTKTLNFELIGADRVGIISEISQAFTENGISIDELETFCSSMPWSGAPMFEASGVLLSPDHLNKEDLMERLYAIEEKLGVDISITEQL